MSQDEVPHSAPRRRSRWVFRFAAALSALLGIAIVAGHVTKYRSSAFFAVPEGQTPRVALSVTSGAVNVGAIDAAWRRDWPRTDFVVFRFYQVGLMRRDSGGTFSQGVFHGIAIPTVFAVLATAVLPAFYARMWRAARRRRARGL